jgi:hypothetical protein
MIEAIVRLCAIKITQPDDLVAKELLFDAFFQKREWPPAIFLAEDLERDEFRLRRIPRFRSSWHIRLA